MTNNRTTALDQQAAYATAGAGALVAATERLPAATGQPGGSGAAGAMLNFIAQRAGVAGLPAEELRILLDMQRLVIADDAREQFNSDLLRVQAEVPRVTKRGVIEMGSKGSMPFATWEDVDAATRPIRHRYGFSVRFSADAVEGGRTRYKAIFSHRAGHSEEIGMVLPADAGPGRNALQAVGSTLSYAKRYLVEAFCNIIRQGVDDDGKVGGTRYLSDEQVTQINDMLRAAGANLNAFLQHFGADSVESSEEKHFTTAMNSLAKKKQQREAGAAGAKQGG